MFRNLSRVLGASVVVASAALTGIIANRGSFWGVRYPQWGNSHEAIHHLSVRTTLWATTGGSRWRRKPASLRKWRTLRVRST